MISASTRTAKAAKKAHLDSSTLKDAVVKLGYLSEIEYDKMDIINNRHNEYIGQNLHHKIKKLTQYIEDSKKPIIIAGQGCNNCSNELNLFAIKNNITDPKTRFPIRIETQREEKIDDDIDY